MENAPLSSTELPDTGRFDEAEKDDDTKDKKKKKSANVLHTRIDLEIAKKRENSRKLGGFSIGAIETKKQETEHKPVAEDLFTPKNETAPSSSEQEEGVISHEAMIVELEDAQGTTEFTRETSSEQIEDAHLKVLEQYQNIEPVQPVIDVENATLEHTTIENVVQEEYSAGQDSDEYIEELPGEVNLEQDTPGASEAIDNSQPDDDSQSSAASSPAPSGVSSGASSHSTAASSSSTAGSPPAAYGRGPTGPPLPPVSPLSPAASPIPPPNPRPTPPINPRWNAPYPVPSQNVIQAPIVNPNNSGNTTPVIEQRIIEKHSGFWTGLAIGGLYEHFKHKKRENILKKSLDNTTNTLKTTKIEQQKTSHELNELTQRVDQSERTKKWQDRHPEVVVVPDLETSPVATIAPSEAVPKVFENTPVSLRKSEQQQPTIEQPGSSTMHQFERVYESPPAPLQSSQAASEQMRSVENIHERLDLPVAQVQEKNGSKIEVRPVSMQDEDEPIIVADDRRVETSSWHRIEIDKATGRAVEDPTIAYGEAFNQERQQEVRAQQNDDQTNVQGQVIGDATLLSDNHSTHAAGSAGLTTADTAATTKSAQVNPIEETKRINDSKKVDSVSIGLWSVFVVLVAAIVFVLVG